MKLSSTSQNWILLIKDTIRKLTRQLVQLRLSIPKILELVMAGGVFILVLVYTLQRAEQAFIHDSFNYWNLADNFLKNGEFSFTNYGNGLRGYFFPFVLFLIISLGGVLGVDARQLFYVFSAFYFSILTIYVLPWGFQSIFCWRISFWGRAVIAILLFIFWRGHFLYPLTDFPAITALLIGVAYLSHSLRYQTSPALALFIGFFFSAAVNIRPVYQLSLIMLIPFFLLQVYRLKVVKAVKWVVFLLLGCCVVLMPQYRINQTHFQVNSPGVLARFGDDENLFVKQLFWGLKIQKYETNIGENYSLAAVAYQDPLFDKLPQRLSKNRTISGYLEIVERYPQDVAISYFRHFFNGIDIFFPTPYVKNLFANHMLFSAMNYLVWLLAAFFLIRTDFAQIDRVQLAGVVAFLAPVILAVPTALEVRFFLPIHLMAYGIIAFGIDYHALAASVLSDKWRVLRAVLVLTLWILVCFTLSAATVENLVIAP
jgi:hypothetical protein